VSDAAISQLLPPAAAAAEFWGVRRERWMYPEERALVAGSVGSRVATFSTGRDCARRAFAELGHPPAAVLSGAQKEPVWPPGLIGSITHCRSYLAAVVAPAAAVPVLGIDAEPHEALKPGLIAVIASPAEKDHLAALPPGVHWDRLLFCVKECVYKAWSPRTGRWLDFNEAEVRFSPGTSSFTARVTAAGSPTTGFAGDWAIVDEIVLAAVTRLN